MKRILVTGASGFIGRSLLTQLVAAGERTLLFACSRSPWRAPAGVSVIHGDLADRAFVESLLIQSRPDLIYHLCGRNSGDVAELVYANVVSTHCVVAELARLRSPARLVVASSAAVYGVPQSKDGIVSEEDSCSPVGPYGITKLVAELVARADRGLDVVIARLFNPIGVGQRKDSLFGVLLEQASAVVRGVQSPVVSVGSLEQVRDFIDVRDVVDALLLLGTRDASSGVYNVGTGVPTTVRKLGTLVADEVHAQLAEREGASPRSATISATVASIEKIRRLGWRPRHGVASAVAYAVRQARELEESSRDIVPASADGADRNSPPSRD